MQEESSSQNEKMRKSRQERIEELEQRMKQLAERKRKLQAMENTKERKARTRRLIQIGAISLKYFNLPDEITPEEYEKVAQKIVTALERKNAFPAEQRQATFPEEH